MRARGWSLKHRPVAAAGARRGFSGPVIGCVAGLVACSIAATACRAALFKEYEYEEEIFLTLDGSASVLVNSSVPALVALRGLDLDPHPRARLDRGRLRGIYSGPLARVSRVGTSRKHNRRFVHVRVQVDDIRQLSRVAPFAWSLYAFDRVNDLYVYRQVVGDTAARPDRSATRSGEWDGSELVAFRLHVPSKIRYHDAPSKQVARGNILVWEQTLAERLAGVPVRMEARIESRSILYRTLSLFGVTIALVAVAFGAFVWWVRRMGKEAAS